MKDILARLTVTETGKPAKDMGFVGVSVPEGWVIPRDEVIRRGVRTLKLIAYTRHPPYELPDDSLLEDAVRAILHDAELIERS